SAPAPSVKGPAGSEATAKTPQPQPQQKAGSSVSQPPPGGLKTPEVWADEMLDRVVEQLNTWHQPVASHGVEIGPTFARLKVIPQGQTDVNKVRRKAENLQIILDLPTRPVIATQAGYISIDVQRPDRQ